MFTLSTWKCLSTDGNQLNAQEGGRRERGRKERKAREEREEEVRCEGVSLRGLQILFHKHHLYIYITMLLQASLFRGMFQVKHSV